MIYRTIKDFFSSFTHAHVSTEKVNNLTELPFCYISDKLLLSEFYDTRAKYKNSVKDKISELEKIIITEDRADDSILSKIDPDLNMLCHVNDIIQHSSKYYDNKSFGSTFTNVNTPFSILNANIRGMSTNLDDFKTLLSDLKFSFPIIGITENWLKPHNVDIFHIKGYSHEYNIRPKKIGGGVSLFLSTHLMYTRRHDIQLNPVFNSVTVDIQRHELNCSKDVTVILVYRPPNTNSLLFFKDLERILNLLKLENKYVFLFGDLNYDTFKLNQTSSKHVDTENFNNILSEFNFSKLIHKPTRIKPPSATLLDNIYTNMPITIDNCQSGILISDISDHFFVFGMFSSLKIKAYDKQITRRPFTQKNISKFSRILNDTDYHNIIYTNLNAQLSFSFYYNFFSESFNSCFPEELVKIKYKNRNTWMTGSLIKCIEKNHKLYKLSIAYPTEINKQTYKAYNNKLTAIKRKAERDHYSDELEVNKSDMRKSWKIMKSIIGKQDKTIKKVSYFLINNKKIDNEIRIANEFNNYFVSVGPTLASNIEITHVNPLEHVNNNLQSIVMPHIDKCEVILVIQSINNSSPGWDGIPAKVAKQVTMHYVSPLTHLINRSFTDGVCPDELKLAKVIPIYKAGSTMELSNYRPISVLNFFSKIFEKIVYNHIIQFLDKHNVLYKNQFGFRQGHSTHHALITLVDTITKSLDNGDTVIGVFLDLKKAFDTVDHKILIRKLYAYGIRGNMIQWIQSYLTNRSQFVCYNGYESDTRDVICGVPQGSILGPLLFLLYINDFARVSDTLFYVLFADDTNVFMAGKYMNKLIESMHNELDKLSTWLKANKLTLNVSKTHFMVFHRGKRKFAKINIKIDNSIIEQVENSKFLGIIIDHRLDWSNHISYINTKLAKGIGILCRAKKLLNKSALLNLYNAFVFPYLIYCVEVWGNALSVHTQPLIRLQNKIVRIITNSPPKTRTESIYRDSGILPFDTLVKHRIGLLMFKLHKGIAPKSLNNLYKRNQDVHSHFTRQTLHLHSMRGNNEFIYRTFIFQSVHLWNIILQNINVDVSFCKFKHLLREYLVSNTSLFRYGK